MASVKAECKGDTARPIRPRDAASLILLRLDSGEHEVLVGRRPPGARFLPGRYVFPGGALEPGDSRARPASELGADMADLMAVGGDDKRARSLAMAAVRETFEETGLLLAKPGDVGPVASESWSVMREQGVAPALAHLTYVGRAITPVRSPIRFHARFFVADARHSSGELGGDSELVDLHWCPVSEIVNLPTIAVQSFMLTHAIAAMTGDTSGPAGKPLFTQRAGQRYIRYDKPRP